MPYPARAVMEGLPRHARTVTLKELVERVVASAYDELVQMASRLPGHPDADRKKALAQYLNYLRQRLTRLALLAEWAPVQSVRHTNSTGPLVAREENPRAFQLRRWGGACGAWCGACVAPPPPPALPDGRGLFATRLVRLLLPHRPAGAAV